MTLPALADPAASARQSKLVLDFAGAALRGGDVIEAQRLLRDHLLKAPIDANALCKLAEIATDQRRFEEAARRGAGRVAAVHLKVGPLSGVVPAAPAKACRTRSRH